MSDPSVQPDQPTDGRRPRPTYLVYVFAAPAIVGLLGVILIGFAVFSTQPIPVRITELPVGALMLIVAPFMLRMSGPLELSLFRSSFKANLAPTLPEALVLAHEAAVEVQAHDDPKRDEKADEAVRQALYAFIVNRTAQDWSVRSAESDAFLRRLSPRAGQFWTVPPGRQARDTGDETKRKRAGEESTPRGTDERQP